MAHETDPNTVTLEEIEIPCRGEYQEIIDRHSYQYDNDDPSPRRGIIRANEQPFLIPMSLLHSNQTRVTVNRNAFYTTIVDQEENKIPSDQYYGSCLCFSLTFLLIVVFAAATHFELAKYFSFLWVVACGIFILVLYGVKSFIVAVCSTSSQQQMTNDNLHHSLPSLLPGSYYDHRCAHELPHIYHAEPPSYALSLSCPVAILEIPFVPSPPPKYRTTVPTDSAPCTRENSPPPAYVELEERELTAGDRIMEEHRQENEDGWRVENNSLDFLTHYTPHICSQVISYEEETEELEDDNSVHHNPPNYA
jgi:hypothetical protein